MGPLFGKPLYQGMFAVHKGALCFWKPFSKLRSGVRASTVTRCHPSFYHSARAVLMSTVCAYEVEVGSRASLGFTGSGARSPNS